MLTFTVADGTLTIVAAQSGTESDSFGFRREYDHAVPVVADVPTDWANATTITITTPNNQGRTCEIGP